MVRVRSQRQKSVDDLQREAPQKSVGDLLVVLRKKEREDDDLQRELLQRSVDDLQVVPKRKEDEDGNPPVVEENLLRAQKKRVPQRKTRLPL